MSGLKGKAGECHQWKAKRQCSKGDACSFRHDDSWRGKKAQASSLASRPQTQNDGRRLSKGSAPRGTGLSGRKYQKKTCRNYFTRNCTNPSCNCWHPPVCQHQKTESGCKFSEKRVLRHDSQPSKKSKKSGGKGSVALFKNSK